MLALGFTSLAVRRTTTMICFFQFSVWLCHRYLTPRIQTRGQKGLAKRKRIARKLLLGKAFWVLASGVLLVNPLLF